MAAAGASRIVGIDYLRAFFSVCVVAVHLEYICPSSIFRREAYETHTFTWSDFVNFYVLCLAVPVFVLISTYLYALKPTNTAGLCRRLGRIVRLLVFWSVLFQIFFFTGYGFVKQIPRDLHGLVLYLMTGGDTVYYFFVALSFVTIVTHCVRNVPGPGLWAMFALSTLLVGVLPLIHREYADRSHWAIFLAHHANPLNFVPFAFAGVGLARLTQAGATRLLDAIGLGALIVGAASAVLDWTVYVDPCFFEVNRFALPAYTRPSLVFLAVAVLVLAVRSRPPVNPVVAFMAFHSLAVYCLHPFFVPIHHRLAHVPQLSNVPTVLISLPVVLGLSYVGSLILPWFLREEVLR